MKKNIVSLISIICIFLTNSCSNKNYICSDGFISSNQESKTSISSNKESDERYYCDFGDNVYFGEYHVSYLMYSDLTNKIINLNEDEFINFDIYFEFYFSALECKKNPFDYYFSLQYKFNPSDNQGTPFYIVKNTEFYNEHFNNQLTKYCVKKDEKNYNIDVYIKTRDFHNNYIDSGRLGVLFIKPCIYASEDGYSYTNGIKDEIVDQEYGFTISYEIKIVDDMMTFAYIQY